MNEILEWIKANTRLVLISSIIIIVLSASIGFFLGVTRRERLAGENYEHDAAGERFTAGSFTENKDMPLFLPKPVIPDLDGANFKYSFYLDDNDDSEIGELELIPVKFSELLKYREIGFESNIKAFQFNNEELDIITGKDELVEP